MQNLNQKVFYFFNNLALQNEILDTIVIFITDWLIYWMLFVVLLLFLFKKIKLKVLLRILILSSLTWLIAKVIREFYFSPRPFLALENVKSLILHGANDSMPSGHSVLASALAFMAYFYNKKVGVIFAISAILIALSRIIVGVHWPLDVLLGLIFGVTISYLLNKYIKTTWF